MYHMFSEGEMFKLLLRVFQVIVLFSMKCKMLLRGLVIKTPVDTKTVML